MECKSADSPISTVKSESSECAYYVDDVSVTRLAVANNKHLQIRCVTQFYATCYSPHDPHDCCHFDRIKELMAG